MGEARANGLAIMNFIYPMAFTAFYIFVVGAVNFMVRKNALAKGGLKAGYFKNLDAQSFQPPEFVIRMGRHYDHHFQLPMLFLITCLVCVQVPVTHPLGLVFAWAFIATRLGHTYIHLGSNKILQRVSFFFAGWLMVLALWVMIVITAI